MKSQYRHINLADAVVGVQACATAAALRGCSEEAKSVGGQKLGVCGREGGGGARQRDTVDHVWLCTARATRQAKPS